MACNLSKTPGDKRRQMIVEAAIYFAEGVGFQRVTSDIIATKLGCSDGLVRQYFPAPELQAAIIEEAVRVGNLLVVGQGLAARHPAALSAPLELRVRAADAMVGERE